MVRKIYMALSLSDGDPGLKLLSILKIIIKIIIYIYYYKVLFHRKHTPGSICILLVGYQLIKFLPTACSVGRRGLSLAMSVVAGDPTPYILPKTLT